MPANILDGLLELSHQILSFSESFDNDTKVLGQSISDDLATMLGLNLNPRQVCWTPRHLKQDVFEDVYNNLDETPNHPPPSKDIFEIDDAYLGSKSTLSAIMECVCQSMLTSGQFRDPENCLCEFQELEWIHLSFLYQWAWCWISNIGNIAFMMRCILKAALLSARLLNLMLPSYLFSRNRDHQTTWYLPSYTPWCTGHAVTHGGERISLHCL